MRRALLALGVVVLIVVAVAAWLLHDASRFIPRVEAAASHYLGRAVHIGTLQIRPDLSVEAHDVTVANVPEGSRPIMLTAPTVTARIGLGGLLRGVIDVNDVMLDRPDLLVERDNILFRRPPATPGATGGTSVLPRFQLVLHRVAVVDGHVTAAARGFELPVAEATRQTDGWDASGTVRDAPLPAWAGTGPLDVQLHVGSDATRVSGARENRRATLTTAPLASLRAAGAQPFELRFEQPGATLHAQGHAGPDRAFDAEFTGQASDLSALWASLPTGPASTTGHARGDMRSLVLDHLTLATPVGDVAGDVTLSNAALPSARGTLASKRLDADALAATLSRVAEALAPKSQPAPATVAPVAPTPAPPPLPFGRLREAEGDLTLSVATLLAGGATFRDAHAHATLADGRLALDPVSATTEAGAATASLHADAGSAPPSVVLMLQAPSLRLTAGRLTGAASARADLTAAGATAPALLASLDGSASAAVVNGEVDNTLAAPTLARLFARLPVTLAGAGAGTTHVRCAVARAAFAGGTATVTPLTLDATRLLVTGEGAVDLAARTLAIRLRPVLQAGPGISIPLLVSGAWDAPRVAPDPHPLPVPTGDACATSLAAIGSALPPPPAAAPAKPPKPADLLRSLLR